MSHSRIEQARQRLLGLRRGSGVWGYTARTIESVEPSSLASLGLLATDVDSSGESKTAAQASARWLSSIRRPDGSLGVSPALPEPGWATPYGVLLWNAVGGFASERASAVAWLLGSKGRTAVKASDDPVGHDSMIVGWPWVADTHSWVEPTAMALLALSIEGKSGHPRVAEGVKLVVDRTVPTGGWNHGNPIVFKTPLRPLPGPTGQALLALSGHETPDKVVKPTVAYLRSTLAETLAPISLGWGLLGLRAWGAEPAEASSWVDSAFDRLASREASTADLALLLLAAGGDRSVELFGVKPRKEGTDHGNA